MSTLRHYISTIRAVNRITSADSMINDRVIASQIRAMANLIIKRSADDRKLWNTDTIFTTIPCLELEPVPIATCCNFESDCMIARSKVPIPSILEGKGGYIIQGVYTIDAKGGYGKQITRVTVNRYINLLKLPTVKKQMYYFITEGYLYVTDPDIRAVRVSAAFKDDLPSEILYNSDCGCGASSLPKEEICKNPLDREFKIPPSIEDVLIREVSNVLRNTYFSIKADVSSNKMDGQAPNVPQQPNS